MKIFEGMRDRFSMFTLVSSRTDTLALYSTFSKTFRNDSIIQNQVIAIPTSSPSSTDGSYPNSYMREISLTLDKSQSRRKPVSIA